MMQEFTMEIEIDENANIKAETKNIKGTVCVNELDNILKDLTGNIINKNKAEYYQNNSKINNKNTMEIK